MQSQKTKLYENRVSVYVGRKWTVVDYEKLNQDEVYELVKKEILRPIYIEIEFDELKRVKYVKIVYKYYDRYLTQTHKRDDNTEVEAIWDL